MPCISGCTNRLHLSSSQSNVDRILLPKDERLLLSPVLDTWLCIETDIICIEHPRQDQTHLCPSEANADALMSAEKERMERVVIVIEACTSQETLWDELIRLAEICR